MIDPVYYRIRIGNFNLRRGNVKSPKRKENLKCNVPPPRYFILLCLGLLLPTVVLNCGLNIQSGGCASSKSYNGHISICLDSKENTLMSAFVCIIDWNSYMKAINGNIKNTISIAHWNGGSSFLGKSEKGREKLNEVENFPVENKLDVLGLSEANLDSEVQEYNYKIQGYHCVKSPGNISRLVVFIREGLIWRELKNFGGTYRAYG